MLTDWLWSSPSDMSGEASTSPPPRPATQPELTPSFCFNMTALRDFLRLSRATVDDSISLHLNSLLTPSRSNPFSPGSTASRPIAPAGGSSRRQIPDAVCDDFKNRILFPSWRIREDVIAYCAKVADNPDSSPPTPAQERRGMHMPSDKDKVDRERYDDPSKRPLKNGQRVSRNYWGEEIIVDERTDPYSGKDYSYNLYGQADTLKNVLDNERGVERIIRIRAWSVLGERCVNGAGRTWEQEWEEWKASSGR